MRVWISIFGLLFFLFGKASAQKPFRPWENFNSAETYVIENIYFDLGKCDIKPESKPALDSLVFFLKKNDNLIIDIQGHLSYVKNRTFSSPVENRAQKVVDYLIENGINANRLMAYSYGGLVPYCVPEKTKYFKKGTVLTEEYISTIKDENAKEIANQLNRRIQIKVRGVNYQSK